MGSSSPNLVAAGYRERGADLSGKRVLVVDDEPDILDSARDVLAGATIETAGSEAEARRKLAEGGWDLVVMDIMGVRGLDLLEEFAGASRAPWIMLTAHALTRQPAVWEEAARLETGPWRAALVAARPAMRGALPAALLLVFLLTLADYTVPATMGVTLYPVEIASSFQADRDASRSAALALPLLGIVLPLALLQRRLLDADPPADLGARTAASCRANMIVADTSKKGGTTSMVVRSASAPARPGRMAMPNEAAPTWKPMAFVASATPKRDGVDEISSGNTGASAKPSSARPPNETQLMGFHHSSAVPKIASSIIVRTALTTLMRSAMMPKTKRPKVKLAQ